MRLICYLCALLVPHTAHTSYFTRRCAPYAERFGFGAINMRAASRVLAQAITSFRLLSRRVELAAAEMISHTAIFPARQRGASTRSPRRQRCKSAFEARAAAAIFSAFRVHASRAFSTRRRGFSAKPPAIGAILANIHFILPILSRCARQSFSRRCRARCDTEG